MAFSFDYKGSVPLGGAELHWGNWDGTGVTTGTVDIRPIAAGSATDHYGQIIHMGYTNAVTAAATAVVAKTSGSTVLAGKPVGTMVITCVSGDRGTWFAITA